MLRSSFLAILLCSCTPTPCEEVLEQNKATIEWLKNDGWTPDCLTQPWPQCMQKP